MYLLYWILFANANGMTFQIKRLHHILNFAHHCMNFSFISSSGYKLGIRELACIRTYLVGNFVKVDGIQYVNLLLKVAMNHRTEFLSAQRRGKVGRE